MATPFGEKMKNTQNIRQNDENIENEAFKTPNMQMKDNFSKTSNQNSTQPIEMNINQQNLSQYYDEFQ